MTKRALIEALKAFNDDDDIMLGDEPTRFVPEITKVCGKWHAGTALYCCRSPGHEGLCYSSSKNMNFQPNQTHGGI